MGKGQGELDLREQLLTLSHFYAWEAAQAPDLIDDNFTWPEDFFVSIRDQPACAPALMGPSC
jgi:hypothetical protein